VGFGVNRGEVWLAEVGTKPRPVLVLTRSTVLDARSNVTVAEITTSVRGIAAEVPVDDDVGLDRTSVINCDGLHTVAKSRLTRRLGSVHDDTLRQVCWSVSYALGC
jgi:mRNA interferase MazF